MDSSNPGPSSSYTLNIAPLILNDISFSVIISILILCKFTQFPQNKQMPICLSLRNNTACCIRLRNLRHLRENKYIRVLKQSAQTKPQSLPQISQITQTNNKQQTTNNKQQNILNLKQPVFLCEIIQLAAFLCVICAICGKITRKSTQTIHTNETPMSPADLADNRRQTPKPQNSLNLKQPVFLCEIMQLCCIRLRDLRHLRENSHVRVLNLLAQIKLQKSPADLADLRRQNTNSKTTITAIISQPSPTCLSLRNNAACCIRLRNLRYLRENKHIRVLKQFAKSPQKVSRRFTQTNPQPPKPHKLQPVFLCEIIQLAVFVCVICVICGRIITQEYSSNHQRNHTCDFFFDEVPSP